MTEILTRMRDGTLTARSEDELRQDVVLSFDGGALKTRRLGVATGRI